MLLFVEAVGLTLVLAWIAATTEPLLDGGMTLVALAAGAAGTSGLFAFYRALAIGTMSVVAPISACGVALPVLVGVLSGDQISTLTAVGMAAAVTGAILATREGPAEDDHARTASRASVLLAIVAAAGFGTFFTLSDRVADDSVPWLLFWSRILAVVVLVALVARARPSMPSRGDIRLLVMAGVLDVLATALYAVALREGRLSVVSVVGSLYPVVTVLLARAILHERVRSVQLAGVGAAFAGIGLIALGR